jgi:hypothetical protein
MTGDESRVRELFELLDRVKELRAWKPSTQEVLDQFDDRNGQLDDLWEGFWRGHEAGRAEAATLMDKTMANYGKLMLATCVEAQRIISTAIRALPNSPLGPLHLFKSLSDKVEDGEVSIDDLCQESALPNSPGSATKPKGESR